MKTGNRITWRSPSNIALIKYWGKYPGQIPANPSLSMTLDRAYSETSLEYSERKSWKEPIEMEFWFEEERNERFRDKIYQFLLTQMEYYPVLGNCRLEIHSRNTFPHSTGIASSASGMSALGLCLASFLSNEGKLPGGTGSFLREASKISRLASGSACRSVYGGYTVWGAHQDVKGSCDEYAIPLPFKVHPDFREMNDAILVVSGREKSVSSTAGHSLMNDHPFAPERFRMARRNLSRLVCALADGDMEVFVEVVEMEALVLHALMMSSSRSFLLFEPNTVSLVNEIRHFRRITGIPVSFTLDAGPNIHLIYPGHHKEAVMDWISGELLQFCHNSEWIDDKMGSGPMKTEDR